MPLFLDIHRNMHGATPASIREGHIADLEAPGGLRGEVPEVLVR